MQINLTSGNTTAKANIVNLMRTESSIENHMELSIYKSTCDNKTLKKTVLIFTGYEYTVKYMDATTGCTKTITGLVESITGDNSNTSGQYITMKYYDTSTSTTTDSDADISVTKGLPNCGCVFNKPDDSKYAEPITIDIPVANISDVNYVRGSGTGTCPPRPPKKGVKVVLLGISAEVVRAVVINLKMIEDGCSDEDSVKDVNLKVGNVYTIAYYSSKDKAMYEFDGKLVAIKETDQLPSTDSVVRTPTTEQYGMNNSIYNSPTNCTCIATDKDAYLCADPMPTDILLTFDISADFSGEYATIMLSWIRDCTPVEESADTGDTTDDDTTMWPNCGCCPGKPIEMTSGDTTVVIDPTKKEVYYNDPDTIKSSVPLQEVIDFYFGGC